MTFRFGSRSERNLIGVHPDLVRVARQALTLSAVDFAITEGLRTAERQRELVRAGKSQTLNSRHLTGHAIDVAAWIGGTVSWEWRHYERINDAFQLAAGELAIPLVWGGSWTTLRDGPHFELSREAYP